MGCVVNGENVKYWFWERIICESFLKPPRSHSVFGTNTLQIASNNLLNVEGESR